MRREASCRSTQRAFCHSHMGTQNIIITREILILAMWFMELKVIIFRCRTDIRDEPARPDPAMTLFDGSFLKYVKRSSWNLSHNKFTDLKIVISSFHRYFFISSEVIAFFFED